MELRSLRGANTEMVQSAGAQVRIGSTCTRLLLILERSGQLVERTLYMFSGAVGPLQACAASLTAADISSVTSLACSLATWQAPQLTKQGASWRRPFYWRWSVGAYVLAQVLGTCWGRVHGQFSGDARRACEPGNVVNLIVAVCSARRRREEEEESAAAAS